jgi:hypothetical protein
MAPPLCMRPIHTNPTPIPISFLAVVDVIPYFRGERLDKCQKLLLLLLLLLANMHITCVLENDLESTSNPYKGILVSVAKHQ